ncbi:uncharacterized protein [Littorina saxatilis]|uniref:Uncharacterized protein n=1 Tax=Littorina saxatilis TaxID=31220 RepID=A0AAN9BDP3_9CAEN
MFLPVLLFLCGEQDGEEGDGCQRAGGGASGGGGASESFEDKMHDIMDMVMHSKMMDNLKALPSEVMEELKALPGELRESLILHVERRSLVVAGVVVAVVAALLLLGCVWINWCHADHGHYRYVPVSQLEEFMKYQKVGLHASHKHPHAPQHPHTPQPLHQHRPRHRNKHKEGEGAAHGASVTHRKSHAHIANGGP